MGKKFASRYHRPSDVSLGDIALAAAVKRHVDGEAKGGVTDFNGLLDMLIDPVGIAIDIQLENP